MALIDHDAADRIKEKRLALGMSPEALAADITAQSRKKPWGNRGDVDAHTIRRIERGHVPGPRVAFVLSAYFGLLPHQMWLPGKQRDRERVMA